MDHNRIRFSQGGITMTVNRKSLANFAAIGVQICNILIAGILGNLSFSLSFFQSCMLAATVLILVRLFKQSELGEKLTIGTSLRFMEEDKIEDRRSDDELMQSVVGPTLGRICQRLNEKNMPMKKKCSMKIIHKSGKNAFAFGRRTICITRELVEEAPQHLEAVLLHEFGHLDDMSTEIEEWCASGEVLMLGASKLPKIAAVISLVKALFYLISGQFSLVLEEILHCAVMILCLVLATLILGVWYLLRERVIQEYRVQCEFSADGYVVAAGLKEELKAAIHELSQKANKGKMSMTPGQNDMEDEIDPMSILSPLSSAFGVKGSLSERRLSMIDASMPMYYNK